MPSTLRVSYPWTVPIVGHVWIGGYVAFPALLDRRHDYVALAVDSSAGSVFHGQNYGTEPW